jgi:hypothetical protein
MADLGIGEAIAATSASAAATSAAGLAEMGTAAGGAATTAAIDAAYAAEAASAGMSFGTAASLASAGVQGIGSIIKGNAQSAAAGYNAKIADYNAKLAQQNAVFAGQAGEEQAGRQQLQTRAEVDAIKANQAKSGIAVNTGSAPKVRAGQSGLGMLDAMTIRSNAARAAYGYETQAVSDQMQEQLRKQEQQNLPVEGAVTGAADLLGGLGQAARYDKWLGSKSL